jgi:hypothetical protein
MAAARASPTRRRRLTLALAALAFALVVAEVAARIALSVMYASPPKRAATGQEARMIDLVQRSPSADLVYELQPRLDCVFQGVRVRTGAHGWRGPEPAPVRPAGGFRVLALGDSILFGWGVAEEQTGVARLQQQLAAALPQRPVEVIGAGVPGYNTVMEVELLRQRGLALSPDVVLVDFCGNDFDLPNFLLARASFWRLDHCYLLDLARRVRRSAWQDPWSPFDGAPMRDGGSYEQDPARVPPEYRHLVGVAAYRRAMAGLRELAEERGFRVLVTSHYALAPEAKAVCAELGLPTVELADRIVRWLRERGDGDYYASALTLSANDPHPTAIVHGWWAEAVAAKLHELRWLPQ